ACPRSVSEVHRQRAAAALRARNDDAETGLPEEQRGVQVRPRKEGVGDATRDEDRRPARGAVRLEQRGKTGGRRSRQRGGVREPGAREPSGETAEPRGAAERTHGSERRGPERARREQRRERAARATRPPRTERLDVRARRLDERAVAHARRARRLARAAPEAR